jgi:hypothetical protein
MAAARPIVESNFSAAETFKAYIADAPVRSRTTNTTQGDS